MLRSLLSQTTATSNSGSYMSRIIRLQQPHGGLDGTVCQSLRPTRVFDWLTSAPVGVVVLAAAVAASGGMGPSSATASAPSSSGPDESLHDDRRGTGDGSRLPTGARDSATPFSVLIWHATGDRQVGEDSIADQRFGSATFGLLSMKTRRYVLQTFATTTSVTHGANIVGMRSRL